MLPAAALRQAWVGVGGPAPQLPCLWTGTYVLYNAPGVLSGVWSAVPREGPRGTDCRLPRVNLLTKAPASHPFPPTFLFPYRRFRGRLPDKTLALESVSQHLLLREPGLRDRTVLTRWGEKLPENAAHTEDARQRPRTGAAPATASCWQAPGFHMSFRASPCGPKHPFPLDLRRPIWCNGRSPLQGPQALALTERGSQPRGQQTVPIPHCHCLRIAFWQLPLCSCLPAGLRPGPPPGDVNSSPLSA